MEATNLYRCESGPLVVRTAQKGNWQDDKAKHQSNVARLKGRAEHEPERCHGNAGEGDHRQNDEPVQRQLRLDAASVHERRNRQHNCRGNQSLNCTANNFLNGHEPNRTRCLHPVFDFTREAKFLGHLQRDGLDTLEHDGNTNDTCHEHRGKNGFA